MKEAGASGVAGLVLAAGKSVRMGRPKQLLKVGGEPLLAVILQAALESRLEKVILVLGHKAREIRESLIGLSNEKRLEVIENDRFEEGLSSSLVAGLKAVEESYRAVMIILGDQPFVRPWHIDLLLDRHICSDPDITVPLYRGRRGHPVIFAKSMYAGLKRLRGDTGGRELVDSHGARILKVEIDDPCPCFDIDTEEDYRRLVEALESKEKRRSIWFRGRYI